MCFYLGVNGVVHVFSKWDLRWVLSGPKKGFKGFKKSCANRVRYGYQAGSKKDFKEFYLIFMQDLKLFRAYSLKRVLTLNLRTFLVYLFLPSSVKLTFNKKKLSILLFNFLGKEKTKLEVKSEENMICIF